MKTKILQKIADSIINNLAVADSDDMINFYFEFGMWFNDTCINYMGVYLD